MRKVNSPMLTTDEAKEDRVPPRKQNKKGPHDLGEELNPLAGNGVLTGPLLAQ